MPDFDNLRGKFLEKAHGSRYSMHSGATKNYCDLILVFWWDVLKRDITEFMAKCSN